ncbi:hypothetical protein [Leifsonia sp. Leaf264]|uniref:hypothetical protein n=1 Tax=Leifsonia sp. Leaf264 TaxID=1736314 RepID=UPI0006F6B86B|nr:hypothetical protein [Leifsonia sp. Leaf264]KQO98390.1 hypothetical protein ASF30_10035 [Leifsonia sp. Leaf264]
MTAIQEPQQADQPGSPDRTGKNRKAIIVSVAAAVVLAIIAVIVMVTASNQKPDAEATAQNFVNALAAGDADTVAKLTSADDVPKASVAAFAGAKSYITDVKLKAAPEKPNTDKSISRELTYTLDGKKGSAVFNVKPGKDDTWSVVPVYMGGVTGWGVTDGVVTATVGGQSIADADRLLPAVYPITASTDSPYYSVTDADTVAVFSDPNDPFSVSEQNTDAISAKLNDQFAAIITDCVSTDDANPDGCGFTADIVFAMDDPDATMDWNIVKEPTLALTDKYALYNIEGSFSAEGQVAHPDFTTFLDEFEYGFVGNWDWKDGEPTITNLERDDNSYTFNGDTTVAITN